MRELSFTVINGNKRLVVVTVIKTHHPRHWIRFRIRLRSRMVVYGLGLRKREHTIHTSLVAYESSGFLSAHEPIFALHESPTHS